MAIRGSTLSLAYAQSHPDRCTGLIIRGIFTFTQEELDFLFKKGGASCKSLRYQTPKSERGVFHWSCFSGLYIDIWPEEWERFESLIPEEQRINFVEEYYKLLTSDDEEIKLEAARRWANWEGSIALLIPQPGGFGNHDDDRWTL